MSVLSSGWSVTQRSAGTTARGRSRSRPGRSLSRRARSLLRRYLATNTGLHLLGLTALTVLVTVGTLLSPGWVPVAAFTLVLLIGGFVLTSRHMVLLYALVAVGVTYAHLNRTNRVGNGILLLLAATALLAWLLARSRWRLGLQGTLGGSMLVDLRDRLRSRARCRRCRTGGTPRPCSAPPTASRSPGTS